MYDGLASCLSASSCGWSSWETYKKIPPLQAPESYSLSRVMDQVKGGTGHQGSMRA
jgi:hypothetical protein